MKCLTMSLLVFQGGNFSHVTFRNEHFVNNLLSIFFRAVFIKVLIPSSCGIFLYRLLMSTETRVTLFGGLFRFKKVDNVCCIFKIGLLLLRYRLRDFEDGV